MHSIYKLTLGTPEAITPTSVRPPHVREDALNALPEAACPFDLSQIRGEQRGATYTVRIPLKRGEQVYGMGLTLKGLNHTGKKKIIRSNADPVADTGDSHAPAPFYVTTEGYGVFVDSCRYISFYAGRDSSRGSASGWNPNVKHKADDDLLEMLIEIPGAQGVTLYIFAGENMADAVNRYCLFSGGGALPPLWGLGIWYRMYTGHDADTMLTMAKEFHDNNLPLDVVGLEPGWQTHTYPCSFVWDKTRIPDPDAFLADMTKQGLHLNLWQHCFTHETSPLWEPLTDKCGDYTVWGGRAPDLADPAVQKLFGDYQQENLIDKGVSGFKMDECDGSDYTGGWSFPNTTRFPSGLDGEQMHALLGLLYQDTLVGRYEKKDLRSYHSVRNSHGLSADRPCVLYSDLYGHSDFIRGVASMGFSGLLWSPEVRDASSVEDLIRRLQAVILSPQALINAWYIKHTPWYQLNFKLNNDDQPMAESESVTHAVRDIFNLRMALVPYLYSAFVRYHDTGRPPFRALVMDHPQDENTWKIEDEYMMGEDILCAPLTAGSETRQVYLPEGKWHDFFTGEVLEGGWHEVTCPLERIPLYVRDGVILPLAKPELCLTRETTFTLEPRAFGENPAPAHIWEDDGETLSAPRTLLTLACENGSFTLTRPEGSAAPCRYHL